MSMKIGKPVYSWPVAELNYSLKNGMHSVSRREGNHGKTDLHQPLHP